jgi:pseudouridine-5'-phosphate glycosidase
MTIPRDRIELSPDVADALAALRPVVALESTIVTHGMPFPANLDTARAVEGVVRAAGAVPATIAVVDGRLRVGLGDAELAALAARKDAVKASRRDLAVLVARGATAGTTVAATMMLAAAAGIRVFATGGIGGVHRGAETTFDISADLVELARTPVTVVCAGAKSILDLPKTMEVLETGGVPVIGYKTATLPAFFARSSGVPLEVRCESAAEIAAIVATQSALGLGAGILVANPIPPEHAMAEAEIDAAIERALADAERTGIRGKDATPFLLARVVEATGGRSLAANIALVKNNARLAAEIAVALHA